MIFALWEFQKQKRKRNKNIFKAIMVENLPNLGKEIDIQIHKAKRNPKNVEADQGYTKTYIIKLPKGKGEEKKN